MSVRRLAMLSLHTSPLAQPGTGDGGGMNVYVHSLATALAAAGVECDVLTHAEDGLPRVVEVTPGFRVVHLGDDLFASAREHLEGGAFDAIHAHYWVSGAVGHQLKHALDLPLVTTFHTLARTKAAAGLDGDPRERAQIEEEVVRCSDRIVASTTDERAELVADYAAEPDRVEVIPPGVDHTMFSPGDRADARHRLRLPDVPTLLFVGRIQPLKRADLALRCLAALPDERTTLVVIGGPSGPDGAAELERLHALAAELGVQGRVRWVPPQRHEALADWYRAADVCIVPSRTESFGLVALEAAACGTPVVATAVGGLRSLVDDGHTGFLVDGHVAHDYATAVEQILGDEVLAAEMAVSAAARSGRYTWSITAARLRRLYTDVGARELLQCS